jgi:hypothetical protein
MQWGLYTPFKRVFDATNEGDGSMGGGSVGAKVAAGFAAGIVASAFITPIDLIMIRQFVESGKINPATNIFTSGLYKGSTPSYRSGMEQVTTIWRSNGFSGLYRGWEPNVARAAMITIGLTVGYDQTKEEFKRYGILQEGFALHLVASIFSGTAASVLCAPMDVIKTRVMAGSHQGWFSCLGHILKNEGPSGLFRGLSANMSRLCPAVMMQLPVLEQLRILAGLDYFGV